MPRCSSALSARLPQNTLNLIYSWVIFYSQALLEYLVPSDCYFSFVVLCLHVCYKKRSSQIEFLIPPDNGFGFPYEILVLLATLSCKTLPHQYSKFVCLIDTMLPTIFVYKFFSQNKLSQVFLCLGFLLLFIILCFSISQYSIAANWNFTTGVDIVYSYNQPCCL